ncbi:MULTISPECIES: FAD binding domain-containing protein [Paenibacillus]|uniref:Carbon-monoxide dehydrogenase medium subunit n=1 Tax=Paenibacillus pabuli TaxID=1472 RepID=A0A855YAZ2_9BACL|nr:MULTISPECIES: FAD binding domain-containing protein [Paenibacillus]PWW38775.1 carbon-monoxide dehydrogenase medium subunit [Paenibacillus pabuli]PXW05960.1 carbon-monoxide dehydrogenase medium subunit [Paenibacillus taichungensis]
MVMPAYGSGAQPTVWLPVNLDELQALKYELSGKYCYAAGATLLRTQWESGLVPVPEHMISLARIQGASGVYVDGEELVIGALTRLSHCATDVLLQQLPLLQSAMNAIAAPSIRNVATIGGNIVSGVGDSIPALLVYDAQLYWMTDNGMEMHSLSCWLNGVWEGRRNLNDVLVAIHIPLENTSLPDANSERTSVTREISFYRKLGRRETFTASLVTIAFHGELGADGRWNKIAIAAGGGSGMAMRLPESEKLLLGVEASVMQASSLAGTVMAEFETYSDAFATEQYRKQTAGNMIGAGLWEALRS